MGDNRKQVDRTYLLSKFIVHVPSFLLHSLGRSPSALGVPRADEAAALGDANLFANTKSENIDEHGAKKINTFIHSNATRYSTNYQID